MISRRDAQRDGLNGAKGILVALGVIVVFWIIVGLIVAAVVHADEPTDARLPDAKAAEFVDAAQTYWARMLPGRAPSGPVVVAFVDDEFMAKHALGGWAGALGEIGGNHIWINRSWWNSYGDYEPAHPCTGIVHEYGHLLNLGHPAAYPIMTGALYDHVPVECGGTDASPNPVLALTTVLYRQKAKLTTAIKRNRVAGLCRGRSHRCRPLVARLERLGAQIEKLEG